MAHKYGLQLLPNLYEYFNPMSHEIATKMEVELAKALRGEKFGVWQK